MGRTNVDMLGTARRIDATIAIWASFAQDWPPVRAFFDALVEILTGAGHKH